MSKFPPLKLRHRSNFNVAMLSAFLLLFLYSTNLIGQSVPEAINYQAIVRDASTFLPISDQAAYVSVEFLDGPDGDVLYQEEFSGIQTGKAGLINLSLGQGNPTINSFDAISWESGNIWLRLSVDVGSGLNILQETPFNTVPYAFFAASSGSSNSDEDGDPTNELIQEITIEGTNLVISEGDQTRSVDLNEIREDEDADPTNEIQSLNLEGSALSISGDESTIDLSTIPGFGADDDSDPSNELQELELTGNSLTLSNSPDNSQVDLGPYLDNTDSQGLSLEGTDLSISGDPNTIDLSELPGLGDDADADPNNEIQIIESTDGSITVTPSGNDFDLSVAAADGSETIINDGVNTTINGTGTSADPYSVDVPDNLDNDPVNEIQDISTDNTSGNIALSDGSTLTLNVDDDDADATNEIQTVESTDGSITVTPSGNDFDLSVAAADGSETIINDGVNTTINGTGTSADPYSIDVPDNLDNDATNEFQDLGNTVVTPNEEVEITLTDGSNTTINIQDADADATNELQTVESTDGSITVTPSGNDFDLSVAAADGSETIINDGVNTTINGTGTSADPYSIDVPDNLDNDPINEIQDISTDNTSGNIALSDGSTLTLNVDDADADATNELQTVESTDGSITVTPSGNDFDLSVAAADGSETIINDGVNTTINGTGTSADPYSIDVPDNLDNDATNEIQDISTDNTSGNIALSDGSTLTLNVDDADADATNELQTVESTDGSITVTPSGNDFDLSVAAADGSETIINDGVNTTINGTGTSADPYSIDVPDNLDNDATNEFQDLGNTVVTPNEEVEITLTDGSNTTINIQDADADSENELQNIQLSGDFLSLTNVSPAAQVDMSPYDQSDLSEGFIFVGDGSDKTSEVQLSGDVEMDSSGDTKVRGIQGTDISGTAPTNGQVLVYNSAATEWQPRSPASVVSTAETSYYSIDPLDFRELTDPVIGVGFNGGNTLKFGDDDAPFAMLRDNGIIEIMAPIHLPHGAEISNLKMYLRDNAGTGIRVSLYRKRMTDFSLGNEILYAGLILGTPGDKELNVNITNLTTVDNLNYSYRLFVRFDLNSLEGDNFADIDDIEQAVYGGVIEYTTN